MKIKNKRQIIFKKKHKETNDQKHEKTETKQEKDIY